MHSEHRLVVASCQSFPDIPANVVLSTPMWRSTSNKCPRKARCNTHYDMQHLCDHHVASSYTNALTVGAPAPQAALQAAPPRCPPPPRCSNTARTAAELRCPPRQNPARRSGPPAWRRTAQRSTRNHRRHNPWRRRTRAWPAGTSRCHRRAAPGRRLRRSRARGRCRA